MPHRKRHKRDGRGGRGLVVVSAHGCGDFLSRLGEIGAAGKIPEVVVLSEAANGHVASCSAFHINEDQATAPEVHCAFQPERQQMLTEGCPSRRASRNVCGQ